MKEKAPLIPTIIGTGFGAGFWPWGPGTAGAFVATAIWFALSMVLSPITLMTTTLTLIIVGTALGTWATKQLEPCWGEDPHQVVIDEMVGVWIPLLLLCDTQYQWWHIIAALIIFRFFDIVKPLGIRAIDRIHGAFWVMADDIVAGIYSLLVLWGFMQIIS